MGLFFDECVINPKNTYGRGRVVMRGQMKSKQLPKFLHFSFIILFSFFVATLGQAQTVEQDLFEDDSLRIDALDLFLFSQQWGLESENGELRADLNGDNVVNHEDLLLFISIFHSEVQQPTPTPTLTPEDATPTPTLTPTPEDATPTPTSVPDVTPTPTNTPEPTSTPTLPPVDDTPTPVPTDTPTPTPEEDTPTPTLTPTLPPSEFEGFFTDFDALEAITEGGFLTRDESDLNGLIEEGRVPHEDYFVIPWSVINTEEEDFGTAVSEPNSAGFNAENNGFYETWQTSILEIEQEFDTTQAQEPVLAFEIAYSLTQPFTSIDDFLVVEILQQDQDNWSLLDINNDGQVVDDRGAFEDGVMAEGSFDGFFGVSNPNKEVDEPLTKEDFQYIEVPLPKVESLRIAFRFESDISMNDEGAYIDDLRVFDKVDSGTAEPQIRQVISLVGDEDTLYVDTENRVQISGRDLRQIQTVLFNSRDGEIELDFTQVDDFLETELPRLSDPSQSEEATLQVITEDDIASEPFTVTMEAAPEPELDQISPSPFYLNTSDTTLRIFGNHFRPAFDGATEAEGTVIIVDDFVNEPLVFDDPELFQTRNLTELVVDAAALRDLEPGPVTVYLRNEYSGLESNSADLNLSGGEPPQEYTIEEFLVSLGLGDYEYTPEEEIYPLQTDMQFSLVWEGEGLDEVDLNIDVGSEPIVINGELAPNVDSDRVEYNVDRFGFAVDLTFAPLFFDTVGEVTTAVRIGNAEPVIHTFSFSETLPPVLYERDDDWATTTISNQQDEFIKVVGDNFRGLGQLETTTRVYLIPAEIEEPTEDDLIELPPIENMIDKIIQPIISDSLNGEDTLYVTVPAFTVGFEEDQTSRQFRIRVVNPDSGLFVDSPPIVEGEENRVLTITND